jgi:hypothetical protein
MTKPEKPAKPDHAATPAAPGEQPATPAVPATPPKPERADPDKREPLAVVDFELVIVQTGPLPTKRTAQKRSDALAHLTCTACGDTADSRNRAMVMRAAHIHARTAHDGARARVRSADNPTT